MVANRLSIDGKVYNTDFVSNRASRVAEEISRKMGLVIANEVRREKEYRKAQADPVREAIKKELQKIAYGELGRKHHGVKEFLQAISQRGIRIEAVTNSKGNVYGLRFHYSGQTFKASEIGREFGLYAIYNQHGQRLKSQKGKSKVPRYQPPESGHDTAPEQSHTRRQSQRMPSARIEPQPQRSPQGIIDTFASAVLQSGGASEDDFYNELEEQKRKKKKLKYGIKH